MTKYKVGDWARIKLLSSSQPKLDKLVAPRFHILEVKTQLCEAGIEQVSYIGRLWSGFSSEGKCSRPMEMREMELDELIEPDKSK